MAWLATDNYGIKTPEQIKVFEAFAGYGSQSLALERLKRHFPEFDYKVVGISDIDKYVVTAYNALHGDVPNYGDISKIDWNKVPDFDLFTYSFPCTNLSNAGKQEGCEEGSGTASSLLWECRKAIVAKHPRYLLMENVKALVSLKFLPYFLKWQSELVSYGYSNFARVLNAKNFGVPQNRERIFMVSILDRQATYHFPEPFPLDRRIKDILEEDVDDRYFLSEKLTKIVLSDGKNGFRGGMGVCTENDDTAPTINAMCYKIQRSNCFIKYPSDKTICLNSKVDGEQPSLEHRVYDSGGIPTAITPGFMQRVLVSDGGRYGNKRINSLVESGKIPVDEVAFLDVYNQSVHTDVTGTITTGVDYRNHSIISMPQILAPRRNEYGKSVRKEYENGQLNESRHKMTDCGMGGGQTPMIVQTARGFNKGGLHEVSPAISANSWECNNFLKENDFKIRKLTPRECLRLMDVDDADIDRMFSAGLSNTQLYKMAGNSIVVNVPYHIFRKMFVDKENENEQLTIF